MNIINKFTGLSPTDQETKTLQKRALEIWRNPYASPEQMEWAMNVDPEGISEALDLSTYTAKRQDQLKSSITEAQL